MRLILEGVSLTRGGRTLFTPANLSVSGGQFAELRGKNGAGKTSLLRAIAGWLPLTSGRVTFQGVEERALAIAYLGHRDGLKSAVSVCAHVVHWAELLGAARCDAEAALDHVGLAAVGDLPARVLSQGQKRRLALARLLAAPRPIWLLDEPAAALDADGKAMLGALVRRHAAGGGIVIAAAHEPIGPNPDQILELGA